VTALEKCQAERSRISEALNMAGVAETLYNKDNIPKNLPCAIVILVTETGKRGTTVFGSVRKDAFSVIKIEETVIKTTSSNTPVMTGFT